VVPRHVECCRAVDRTERAYRQEVRANLNGLGSAYHVLARDRHQAEGLTQAEPGDRAIVALRVPDDQRADYLTCSDGPCQCGGVYSGLLKPLPMRMVFSVEDI
jgi:hypothetical protein